jgi:hypothetical protein
MELIKFRVQVICTLIVFTHIPNISKFGYGYFEHKSRVAYH